MIGSLPILESNAAGQSSRRCFFMKGMILWLNLHHPEFKLLPLGRTSL